MQSKGRLGERIQAASASSSSSASLLFDSLIVTSKSPGCNASPIATETPLTTPSTDAAQILRQRKLEVDRRTLLVDAPLATFGDHDVPLWVDASLEPKQRTLTVRVEPKR